MTLQEFYDIYGKHITQDSERLFVDEFLYPLLQGNIQHIKPQYQFLDQSGKCRRIDFAYIGDSAKIALEVNGETYHAQGIIPDAMFDDNLFRQNEILRLGYILVRYSYSQLQSQYWRPIIHRSLRDAFADHAPELIAPCSIKPNPIQKEALHALDFFRTATGRSKGVVILPTGTGKTLLSAMDARRFVRDGGGKGILFLVHRLDILDQSIEGYKRVWPDIRVGILTGDVKKNELDCDVLFASKDALRRPNTLAQFPRYHFKYIIVDEVHHGQSPTYREIIDYFRPSFMLGMTATPDRNDRRDILALFEYSKIYELPLQDAIERGYLVPYTYYGLTDSIDYSNIRYQGRRYNVADLERYLIVEERNRAIVKEYLEKGQGDKAIAFCVSITHAERMTSVFKQNGIRAVAIHSQSSNRDQLLEAFRNDRIQVAFTVDLFNEGIDFPNVQVLLFLRPTESKTVFLQQLGRGLRLCTGKSRLRVLDFIGNYRRANQIRKFLASHSERSSHFKSAKGPKVLYRYSTGCEVIFDERVEKILDEQDAKELGITKDDLERAYFSLAEDLGRKPSRQDIDIQGEHKSSRYAQEYGSWTAFLRSVGEYTEASYHYPQGTHLGHILAIIHFFGLGNRSGSPFEDRYIRLRGGLGEGRISTYRRQIKYKLQAAMELKILSDDRIEQCSQSMMPELTVRGRELHRVMDPLFAKLRLDFPRDSDGIPKTVMAHKAFEFNQSIRQLVFQSSSARELIYSVFLNMHAVQQMLAYLYHTQQTDLVSRKNIYENFFDAPFVKYFCDLEGIEVSTVEASRRRCPFLINVLDACGIVDLDGDNVRVRVLALTPLLVKRNQSEDTATALRRLRALKEVWPDQPEGLDDDDRNALLELFGQKFLTSDYHLSELIVVNS